jgi:hypothetical protein
MIQSFNYRFVICKAASHVQLTKSFRIWRSSVPFCKVLEPLQVGNLNTCYSHEKQEYRNITMFTNKVLIPERQKDFQFRLDNPETLRQKKVIKRYFLLCEVTNKWSGIYDFVRWFLRRTIQNHLRRTI